jgi:hypothetical protein
MDLELIRKYISAKEIIEHYSLKYSEETIKSVLYGRRKNENIVQLACTYAVKKMSNDIVQIKSYIKTEASSSSSSSSSPGAKNDFMNLSSMEKVRFICKCSNLVEVNQLKKELIKKKVFNKVLETLPKEVQMFLLKPATKELKLLRVACGSGWFKSKL